MIRQYCITNEPPSRDPNKKSKTQVEHAWGRTEFTGVAWDLLSDIYEGRTGWPTASILERWVKSVLIHRHKRLFVAETRCLRGLTYGQSAMEMCVTHVIKSQKLSIIAKKALFFRWECRAKKDARYFHVPNGFHFAVINIMFFRSFESNKNESKNSIFISKKSLLKSKIKYHKQRILFNKKLILNLQGKQVERHQQLNSFVS